MTGRIEIGQSSVEIIQDGLFKLDGGAMFGVVPKVMWEKIHPPDEKNRITMGLVSLLVTVGDRKILIETGIGSKFDEKFTRIYGIERPEGLEAGLLSRGVDPEEISTVILTHLHFDHAGGLTRLEGGKPAPVFTGASHVVQARELESALHPSDRSRPSYLPENIDPIQEAGLFSTVSGEVEVEPGIRVVPMPGHTPGHQIVLIEGGGKTLVFWGDLIPTSGHTHPPFVMGYDLEPEVTLEMKKECLEKAHRDGWLLTWAHEPEPFVGRLEKESGKYSVVKA